MLMAVAVYRPEDYPRLLAMADDASRLEPTWQKWHQVFLETEKRYASSLAAICGSLLIPSRQRPVPRSR